jgi:hypothetical protein
METTSTPYLQEVGPNDTIFEDCFVDHSYRKPRQRQDVHRTKCVWNDPQPGCMEHHLIVYSPKPKHWGVLPCGGGWHKVFRVY